MYKVSKYLINIDLENGEQLIFSTRTGELLNVSNELFSSIQDSSYDKLNDKLLFRLLSLEILVPDSEDETEAIINNLIVSSNQKSKILNLTIQPTANCQLGCHYCGQVHEKLNMSESLIEETYEYIKNKLQKGRYEGLFITWYGAEPLLGLAGIKYLSKRVISLCDILDVKYTAMMITNGLALKEKVFEELVCYNITKYQITLDGDKETHNNSRYTKKKGETFDAILSNVVSAVSNPIYEDKNCTILIRCNVHKDNYLSIDSLIKRLYDLGISGKISMDFAPVHDWGKNYAKENIGLNSDYFGELEINWILKMKEYGFKFVKDLLPEKKRGSCMITNLDSELIDAKGRLSYCWETPYTPEFDFENSNMFHGCINKIEVTDRKTLPLGRWYDDIKEEKYNTTCKKCIFLSVCAGGCPIHWYKEIAMCPSFKYNIEDRMILEYINNKEKLYGEQYLSY